MNCYIPMITKDYFEQVYIEHVCDVLRITEEEFEQKLGDISSISLNKKAERFITTYLKNKIGNLTEDNWLAAKELFIQWKLFEGIELERESIDKKESLLELLELFRQEVIEQEEENNAELQERVAKIVVVGEANDY